jgi:transposase
MDTKNNTHKTYQDWREARRFRAWELHQQGWQQKKIAEALGVTRGAVSQWIKAVREGGVEALRSATSDRGRKPKLSEKELARLPEFLERGAAAYGFRGAVWTRARVGKVIRQEFGVKYSPRHVGRLLKRINWTPQKPVERADRRDEEEITEWYEETFPELKKKLPEKDERSYS